MANIDLKLTENSEGIYDLTIDDNGDLASEDSFDTAIIMSLLTDKRADEAEVKQPQKRRGWWGNALNDDPDYEIGSKLWVLEQERSTQETTNRTVDFSFDSLNWFLDDALLEDIIINGTFDFDTVSAEIKIIRKNNESIIYFKLWENTLQ